jgi:hypothetical protein
VNVHDDMAGKNTKPPPLPIEVFERVLRVGRFDGKTLVILATTFAALAALNHHGPPAIAGVIAVGWGLLELHGSERLQNGDPQGLDNMILAQAGIMLTVVAYAAWMFFYFDVEAFMAEMPPALLEQQRQQLVQSGFSSEDMPALYQVMVNVVYALVAMLTLVFQGLMIRYYQKARPAVHTVIYGPQTN